MYLGQLDWLLALLPTSAFFINSVSYFYRLEQINELINKQTINK